MARDSEQVLSVDEVLALIAANPLEDERGVDISQIKRQLAMTPAERLADLTDYINRISPMIEYARTHGPVQT